METQTMPQVLQNTEPVFHDPVKPVQPGKQKRKPLSKEQQKARLRTMSSDSAMTLAESPSAQEPLSYTLSSKAAGDSIQRPMPSALQRDQRLRSMDSAMTLNEDNEQFGSRRYDRQPSIDTLFDAGTTYTFLRRKSSLGMLNTASRGRLASTDSAISLGSDDGSSVNFTDNYPQARKSFRKSERPVFRAGFFDAAFGQAASEAISEETVDPTQRINEWQSKQSAAIAVPPVSHSPYASLTATPFEEAQTPASQGSSFSLATPADPVESFKTLEFTDRLQTYIPTPSVAPKADETIEEVSDRLEVLAAKARLEPEVAEVRLEEAVAPAVTVEKQEKEEDEGLPKPVAAEVLVKSRTSVSEYVERKKAEFKVWKELNYSQDPDLELVLPTPPTDAEKLSYLDSNRKVLFGTGVFSFLSLAAGMWLFVQANAAFYWFGAVAGFLQVYLTISYFVGLMGKDFDYKGHQKVLEDFPIDPLTCPTVDIYLPCCKEPMDVIRNTYKYIKALKYPEGKLKVYVLDDGGLDAVKQAAEEFGFTYITRDNKPHLKKAGNLRYAFTRTDGDFFVIYDADFCPRDDFLLETIPEHMAHPNYAILQTPQFFRVDKKQSWVEKGAGATQELFYRYVQPNRDRWGAAICVGSCAVYRREALVETGGTAEIGHSEDVHTGFFAMTRGWRVKYMPINLALGICPDTCKAFFSQQNRWCTGSTTLLTNPDFWRSPLSMIQKMCFLSGMMYYTATAVAQFINPMPSILLVWAAPKHLIWYNLAFVLPSLINSTIVYNLWARSKAGNNIQFVKMIQAYAHLTAIKDKILGTSMAWVPSGDTKSHKSTKYRNMRLTCIAWTISFEITFIVGAIVQGSRGLIAWYNFLPLIAINLLNFWSVHKFIFCN